MTGPILVFDSGVGGLSVLRELRWALPAAHVVYAADNAGFPYGSKSEAEIAARVPALLGRMVERFDPQLVVIACNTASTIALAHVRAALDVPVVGTVPAIKPAAALTRSKVIGVLGTPATVRQAYVDQLSQKFASDCIILRHGAGGLAALAEAKLRGEAVAGEAVAAEVAGLLAQPGADAMDVAVLACTHFPLLDDELRSALGPRVQLIDGAQGIARRAAQLLAGAHWPDQPVASRALFTARAPDIAALEPALARHGLATVQYL